MSWSFVAVASGYASGMGTTLDCGTTLNVAAGDLLVAIAAVYNYSTTFSSIADTASGNSMTISTRLDDPSGDGMIVAAYKIGATANSTSTFRLTLSNQANYRGLIVIQARPDSGDTVELGFSPSGNTGTGTAITSGSGSASGNDIFAVAGPKPTTTRRSALWL